ncbi:MAG TPA: GNAT family N-acetyltransferase [Kofleriaceae bacterium]|jgi:ribosomal protein S18 acetylase RimI-like enzyme|nr:GNAT family N-acetyltransferase [Kofleriaceae bacterium]
MIALREGPDVDLAALAELRARCEFAPLSDATLAAQLAGSRWVAHAHVDAKLVGFARAISDGVTTAYVSNVMVDPAYRRRGVGRSLLAALTAGRDGIKFVLHTRTGSRAFYEASGFADAADMMVRDRR